MTERPDRFSAAIAARAQGSRVEVTGERTPYQLVFANSDGTYTMESAAGPERVQRPDGTWAAIDTTLVAGASGEVRPVSAAVDMVLSGGAADPAGAASPVVATVQMPATAAARAEAAESVASATEVTDAPVTDATSGTTAALSVGWPGALPVPVLSGSEATYADVAPGMDLRVLALPRGLETFVDIKEIPSPVPADGIRVELPLSAKGLTVLEDGKGGLLLKDRDGAVLSRTPRSQI